MRIEETAIPDVKIITPSKHGDGRGFFSEIYNAKGFADAGIAAQFVQDNQSLSIDLGVLRGLHYQLPPFAQDKLVRVIRGRVLDVAVDLRRSSPSFGQHVTVELSADNFRQILVPVGFAHGFVTLEPNSEVLYKVSNYYSPKHERGISWRDPDLGIDWQVGKEEIRLSERDMRHPLLSEATEFFD